MKNSNKVELKDKEVHKIKSEKKPKKKLFKWVGLVFLILLAVISFNFYVMSKEQAQRRVNSEKQIKLMAEYWESQGLSQEEIGEKLKEERPGFDEGFQPSILQRVIFTARRATGSDPRDGSGRAIGGGQGRAPGSPTSR